MIAKSCFWPSPEEHARLINRSLFLADMGFFIWRLVGTLLSFFPLAIVLSLDPPNFVFYLTDWGLIMTCIYFCYALMLMIRARTKRLQWLNVVANWKAATFLLEIAWTTEFVIFLCYWVGSIFFTAERTTNQKVSSYIIHSVPFLLLLVEMLLNMIRFHKLHFITFQPVYVTYGFANWLYVKLQIGKDPVYPYVTWDNWQTVFGISLAELVAFLGFLFAYFVAEWKYRRLLTQKRIRCLSEEETESTNPSRSFLSTV